jgi:hypothetical protein
MIKHSETVYIVGAGFSRYAGLPLQSEFTKELLEPREDKSDPDYPLVTSLADFINKVFDHSRRASARYWPTLEDIFTCIDLSANTGHHLGFEFSPADLRTVRRALLTRIITMLHQKYGTARKTASKDWHQLSSFFRKMRPDRSAFISINWDTVIEQRMNEIGGLDNFDYGCRAMPSDFPARGRKVEPRKGSQTPLRIIKIHGSINWLYCDSCRRLHWFPAEKSLEIAAHLLSPREWKKIDRDHERKQHCSRCERVCLATRIATFSYLKALDFPMFQSSWFSAEHLLRHARRWIFIGYSLPAADFEFKYLLKRIQTSRQNRPEIILVTGGEDPDATYYNYQRFFGRIMDRKDGYFSGGLTPNAIDAIV